MLVFEPWLPLGDHSFLLDAMVAFERPQEASFEHLDVIEAVEKVVVVAKQACLVGMAVFESLPMPVLDEMAAFAPLMGVVELDQ